MSFDELPALTDFQRDVLAAMLKLDGYGTLPGIARATGYAQRDVIRALEGMCYRDRALVSDWDGNWSLTALGLSIAQAGL